jgi:hypothetical protein
MAARDFSSAGISPARLARGVSFNDVNDAEKEIWSAFFWGSLPAITGTGASTLADTTSAGSGAPVVNGTGAVTLDAVASSGSGTPVIVGTGAVTLDALTSAGSGSSGASVAAGASRITASRRVRGALGRPQHRGR